MCGIAGIVDLKGCAVEKHAVRRMCRQMIHRGPDAEGYFLQSPAALGHRRLSIIDLAGGAQPMSNEDGTVWVTFNGEIYNFRELREQLVRRGHRFVTDSDTEVIVHAYEQFGTACVEHFRGMFAFAVWDVSRSRLLLARDRVGKKPLFYAEVGGQFVFASELQGLLADPRVSRDLDVAALDDYLNFGYVPAPKSIFRQIAKLPPAHCLILDVDDRGGPYRMAVERYWRLEYGPKWRMDRRQACEALEEQLTEAVRLRMVADVPLGVLLSGGIDSSVILALMTRVAERPVCSFSVGFDDAVYNELPFARQVADHCRSEHHELIVEPQSLDILPTLVRHYGEPFADSSSIATYHVARLTRRHVTVALNGDGGDECFAGYERHLGIRLAAQYQRIPRVLRRGLCEPAARLLPRSLTQLNRLGQVKRFIERSSAPIAQQYVNWITYFPADRRSQLYNAATLAALAEYDGRRGMEERLAAHARRSPDPLDQVLGLDVETYLPYDLLVKMDIASMACSLEARSPFLDHKVMEFCARLPVSSKRSGMTAKVLLRDLASTLLPADVLGRRKMGFGLPIARWLRTEQAAPSLDVLLSPLARVRQLLDQRAIRGLIREHCQEQIDRAPQVWSLLWLEIWLQEVCEGASVGMQRTDGELVGTSVMRASSGDWNTQSLSRRLPSTER